MGDEEQMRDDSLTEGEEREVEEGTMDPEEAHRFGEFEELHEQLSRIETGMDSVLQEINAIRDSMSIFVENGAVINDGSDDSVIIVDEDELPEEIGELEELDLKIDG